MGWTAGSLIEVAVWTTAEVEEVSSWGEEASSWVVEALFEVVDS